MVNFSERLEFVHSFNHRFFYHVDFDKRTKVKKIVADIPDKGKFDDGWDKYRERVFARAKAQFALTFEPESLFCWPRRSMG